MRESARQRDQELMERAARLALRGHGNVEPNPLVGCVIADSTGHVVAEGYHAHCGEAHAERIALKRAGKEAQNCTLYTTLEPCSHHGRTPPCTDAIIEAGIARVFFGTSDPHDIAAGGASLLNAQGIETEHLPTHATDLLNAPYLYRLRTGLPWIIAKWAQTLDGRIATSSGDSQWISSARSRRLVHRQRGRVDAILTGIGTVCADNPQLTARDVRRPRRIPDRIIIDDTLETPIESTLIQTARDTPTVLLCRPEFQNSKQADALTQTGAIVEAMSQDSVGPTLARIAKERSWSNILVEAGGGVTGRLLKEHLINELLVFIAPQLVGDADAPGPIRGMNPTNIRDGITVDSVAVFPRRDDIVAWYRT